MFVVIVSLVGLVTCRLGITFECVGFTGLCPISLCACVWGFGVRIRLRLLYLVLCVCCGFP